MKFFTVDLKKEFPALSSRQTPTLTCYINDNSSQFAPGRKNPAILIAPGGGYCNVCFTREGEPIAFHYLRAGFSAFVLTYSVTPEYYPQQLLEAAAAMLYIRSHAQEWDIDPDKIAISGFSAGGHLAASLGVFWQDPFITDPLKAAAESLRPDAMILGYPVISADPSFCHAGSIQNVSGTTDRDSALYKKMSLENHVTEHTPPAYIWHTADDTCVPVKNSLCFALALSANKVPYELHIFPQGPHGLATADFATNPAMDSPYISYSVWIDESLVFLKKLWYTNKE